MIEVLSDKEKRYILEMIEWERNRKKRDETVYNLLLLAGFLIVVSVAMFTFHYRSDRTVLFVTVPGFIIGVMVFIVSIFYRNRIDERARFVSMLKRLQNGAGLRDRGQGQHG